MGHFSYACSNRYCKEHAEPSGQDSACRPCVVRIKDQLYHASYSMYGSVYIKAYWDKTEKIEVHLDQFSKHFNFWGNVRYVATDIYCNGKRKCAPTRRKKRVITKEVLEALNPQVPSEDAQNA